MKDLVCPRAVLSSRQVALCGRMRPSSKFPVWATFSDDIKLFSPTVGIPICPKYDLKREKA